MLMLIEVPKIVNEKTKFNYLVASRDTDEVGSSRRRRTRDSRTGWVERRA